MMSTSREDKAFWLEFIELYRGQPSLWKIKSAEYSDRRKKIASYDILVSKLQQKDSSATKDTVAKKINSMRSAFRKECTKVINSQRSGASSEDLYHPTLWYFQSLMFLKDQETPRESVNNIDEVRKISYSI